MSSLTSRFGVYRSTFFNHIWFWGAGILILLGMILREPAVSLLGLVPLVTAGGSWLWARYSLDGVEYERSLSTDRVFAGDRVDLKVQVTNRKLLPLARLEIEDDVADRLRIIDRDVLPSGIPGVSRLRITTAMKWYERVSWNMEVECPARGYYSIGPVSLRSSDAFGFFQQRRQIEGEEKITVYPRIANLDDIAIPARHLFGELRIRRPIITDPARTIGVRDYRPEDSFRHVHWKATARAQRLQTKVFEPTTSVQYGIFLNLDTFEHYWEGLDFVRAEGAIVTAATLASDSFEAGNSVGMYANGVVGGSDQPLRVRPSRDASQLEQILTGLAKLSPIASLNFPNILRAETTRFPIGSAVVIVSAIMTDAIRAVMDALVREGHRVVLVSIDDEDVPYLPRVDVFRVSLDLLRPYIPRQHHYAVRLPNVPLQSESLDDE